jgi:hypothetical protein
VQSPLTPTFFTVHNQLHILVSTLIVVDHKLVGQLTESLLVINKMTVIGLDIFFTHGHPIPLAV